MRIIPDMTQPHATLTATSAEAGRRHRVGTLGTDALAMDAHLRRLGIGDVHYDLSRFRSPWSPDPSMHHVPTSFITTC